MKDWLQNMWDPVQNEKVSFFVQKTNDKFQNHISRALNQTWALLRLVSVLLHTHETGPAGTIICKLQMKK